MITRREKTAWFLRGFISPWYRTEKLRALEKDLGHRIDQVMHWNEDKPHRCPQCHVVAIDMEKPSKWRVYECCSCGTWFAGTKVAKLLPFKGVRCSVHREN